MTLKKGELRMSSTNVHSEKKTKNTTEPENFTYELCGGYVASKGEIELTMPPENSRRIQEGSLLSEKSKQDYVVIKATSYERDKEGIPKDVKSKSTKDVGRGE